MATKKGMKDIIIEVLDKHALGDTYKYCGLGFTRFFDLLEEKKNKLDEVKEEYKKWASSDYYDGKPTPDEMKLKVSVAESTYLMYLEDLYSYLIGAQKYGE